MRTHAYLSNPDEMDFTIVITMDLRSWRDFRDELPESYHCVLINNEISSTLNQANKIFHPNKEKKGEIE